MGLSKSALKKQLQILGINIKGNYVKKSEVDALLGNYKVEADDGTEDTLYYLLSELETVASKMSNIHTDVDNIINQDSFDNASKTRTPSYIKQLGGHPVTDKVKNLSDRLEQCNDYVLDIIKDINKELKTAKSAVKTYPLRSNIKRSSLIKFIDDNHSDHSIQIEFVNSKGLLQTEELDSYDDKQIRVDGLHFGIDLEKIDGIGVDGVWYGVTPPAKDV